jgi:hypothetical protein
MSQDTIQNSKIWRVAIFLAGVFRSEEKELENKKALWCSPAADGGLSCADIG